MTHTSAQSNQTQRVSASHVRSSKRRNTLYASLHRCTHRCLCCIRTSVVAECLLSGAFLRVEAVTRRCLEDGQQRNEYSELHRSTQTIERA
jgi:hypothetical protein